MEFSFPLTLTVIFLNLAVIAINFLIQQLELAKGKIAERGSIIPGTRQEFLHWQDFHAQRIGDTVFLNGMFIAFWHLLLFAPGAITFFNTVVFVIIFCVDSSLFSKMCTKDKRHKPDWGFPKAGKVSWGGTFHSFYHGFGVAVATFCLWHYFYTDLLSGFPAFLFWVGVAGYVACFVADIRAGHFAKLKLEENSN